MIGTERHGYASASTQHPDRSTPADRRAGTMAPPQAVDVFIIGEPVIGGTLKGSYVYVNDTQNPEQGSTYRWTVDGLTVSNKLELRVIADYVGKEIVFHVVPMAASGEKGPEAASDAKIVQSGFQNISDEENECSFMKQHGNFSFYTPEPSDRIFVSTGGAFSLIDAPSQSVHVHGKGGFGEVVPASIQTYLKNNPAVVMFSTMADFAALVPLGNLNQLLAWGRNMPINQDLTKLRNIAAVYSNRGAFAFIYKGITSDNKRIGALGAASHGGTVPDVIHLKLVNDPPVAIYATLSAFVVRTEAGKVYAWGDTASGGQINASASALLERMKVTRIVANGSAFCAMDDQGQIVPWGNTINGGTIPADRLAAILDQGGVKSVIASRAAFCAITLGRAKAVSWGNATQGGTMNVGAADLAARGNIVLCRAATWAFCMVNAQGQADAWGVANSGGTIPTLGYAEDEDDYRPADAGELFHGAGVRQAIRQLFLDKMARAGIDIRNRAAIDAAAERLSRQVTRVGSRIIVEDGEISIHANDSSFFLSARDEYGFSNQILVWGQANGGGSMSDDTRQALMASQVQSVYCTNGAYGVICTQGRTEGVVVVWGATLAQLDAGEIPKSPPEIPEKLSGGIVELYSIKREPPVNPTTARVDPSFAARHEDGTYVLWGGNVDNQVYVPQMPEMDAARREIKARSARTGTTYRYEPSRHG